MQHIDDATKGAPRPQPPSPSDEDALRERLNDMMHRALARATMYLAERGDMVVLSSDEYESLRATVEILEDDEAMDDIRRSERQSDEEAIDLADLRRRRGVAST